jgi:hypothetical protein
LPLTPEEITGISNLATQFFGQLAGHAIIDSRRTRKKYEKTEKKPCVGTRFALF